MNSPSTKRRALLSGLLALPLVPRQARGALTSINLNYARKYQVIEGFGTCINTWTLEVAAAYQKEDFLTFYREALGASALRVELWGGIASAARDRWQDVSWRDFQFDGLGARGLVTTEVAKRLNAAYKGSLRIIATAWSPPAWMKVNGSLGNGHPERKNYALNFDHPVERGQWTQPLPEKDGNERYQYIAANKLRRDRYLHFAKLLVEWTRYFRSLGINLYALSPTNEPRFSHWFGSCVYTPEEYSELIETVAWMFTNQGEGPMTLFGPEHMTWDAAGNRLYLEALRTRPAALKGLAAIASHGYVDGYTADLRKESTATFGKLAASYSKRIWLTEGGFGNHEWPAPLHQLGTSFLHALRDGGVSLITSWQTLTLYPPNEHGLMSVRGPTKKTYAAMQFSRFIRPGMVRIGANASGPLDAVAFEDPRSDKTILVLLNRTKSGSPVSLQLTGRRTATIESAYVTDAARNCAPMPEWRDPRGIPIPAESLVSLVLRTVPAA